MTPETGTAERELIDALRAGSDEAAETLVRQEAPRLLRVARRFLVDEAQAEDAVQEAFLAAFRSLDTFRGDAPLAAWLRRIVVNVCLKQIRARAADPVDLAGLLPSFDATGCRIEPLRDAPAAPDVLLERREVRDLVRSSIDALPDTHRTALLLRDIEGYSTREAAELLGITEGALRVRLHRARAALKTLLEPVLGPHRDEER
ncbi:MAG: sigma-70 family RNA polymerase sigma factor [Gemmatimonadota bacterium]|nr:sigma-70 family RNA polymerase sigma factor [Gemmatimonadota bacterium]